MQSLNRIGLASSWAIALLATAACHPARKDAPPAAPMFTEERGRLTVPSGSPLRSRLAILPAGGGPGLAELSFPAAVEADPARIANIVSPLTGRVTALRVRLGEIVKKGQVLAVLDSGDFDQAKADQSKAHDALDLATKALARVRGVQRVGGASGKDIEAAQSSSNQAQAEAVRADGRLAALNGAAGQKAHALMLRAPQDGTVTTLAVAPGAQVDDPTAVLMTVTNLDRVFVTGNVAENEIGEVSIGADADINLIAEPSRTLRGKIVQVDVSLQPDTRRQRVRVALANGDGHLLPNMYATLRVAAPARGGVVVPQSALLMNNDSVSVLVEVQPWVFERRAVRLGDETDKTAQVVSGLSAGERIVVRGGILLND
jgi:cobalt-zinc-cadmium efflux system membrane fusion protein